MSLRYDAAFYVQVLDKYVATGACAAEKTNQQIQRVKAGKRIVQGYRKGMKKAEDCLLYTSQFSVAIR